MHRFLFSLILTAVFSLQTFAQTTLVKGVVKSVEDSVAIEHTSVIISKLEKTATCNKYGEFYFSTIPYGEYTVKVSTLGYESLLLEFKADSSVINLGDIFIKPKDYVLKEFVIEAETPIVTQNGDTTIYNTSTFAIRPDDNADDLLAKMPGVVNDGNEVKIQGKTVKKVYLDNREFLGDVQSSLKNIPAEAIANIQVYEESSEQARFAGIKDKDAQSVVNIKTKNAEKTKKLFDVDGGGGVTLDDNIQALYKTGGNYMLMKPSGRAMLMGGINNLNLQSSSQGDIGGISLSSSSFGGSSGSSVPGEVISAGMNLSQDFKKFTTTGSYTYSRNKQDLTRDNKVDYFPIEGQFNSKEEQNNTLQSNLRNNHVASMSLRSLRTIKKYTYSLDFRLRNNDNESESSRLGSTVMNGNPISRNTNVTHTNSSNLGVGANAVFGYQISEGRTIRLASRLDINKSDNYSNPTQSELEYYDLSTSAWIASPTNTSDRLKEESRNNEMYSTSLYYTEPISKSSKLSASLNISHTSSWQQKDIYSYDPITEEYIVVDAVLSGDYREIRNRQSFDLDYDYKKSDNNLSFSVSMDFSREAQNIRSTLSNEKDYDVKSFIFSPNFRASYNLSKRSRVIFSYRGNTLTPNARDIVQEIDDSSPTNVRVGNPDLKKGFQNMFSVSFNGNNMSTGNRSRSYNLGLMFRTTSNTTAYQTEMMPIDRDTILYFYPEMTDGYIPQRGARILRPISLKNAYSVGLSGSYGIYLPKIKSNINLNGDYNFSHRPMMYGKELNKANSNTVSGALGVNSRISSDFDINFRYGVSYSSVTNSMSDKVDNSYISQNINLSLYYKFWKDISILPSFSFYQNKNLSNSGYSQNRADLNISLSKQFLRSKNGRITLSGHNLLNQDSSIGYSVREDRIIEYRNNSFGRFVLLSFSYKFNSMRSLGLSGKRDRLTN